MDLNRLTLVGEYNSPFEARSAAAVLEQHGIRAVLSRDPKDRNPRYGHVVSLRGKPDVMDLLVPENDAAQARAVLGEYREIAEGPLPAGFRDEDLGAWLEAHQLQREHDRRRTARARRVWIPLLGIFAAAMIVVALLGLVRGLG
jgi:hypothetical protein